MDVHSDFSCCDLCDENVFLEGWEEPGGPAGRFFLLESASKGFKYLLQRGDPETLKQQRKFAVTEKI